VVLPYSVSFVWLDEPSNVYTCVTCGRYGSSTTKPNLVHGLPQGEHNSSGEFHCDECLHSPSFTDYTEARGK
jgi:hypothetical protein